MKNIVKFLLVTAFLMVLGLVSSQAALDTTFPFASGLMDQVSTPFNTALGWVIGATAVLLAIRWIKKAAGR